MDEQSIVRSDPVHLSEQASYLAIVMDLLKLLNASQETRYQNTWRSWRWGTREKPRGSPPSRGLYCRADRQNGLVTKGIQFNMFFQFFFYLQHIPPPPPPPGRGRLGMEGGSVPSGATPRSRRHLDSATGPCMRGSNTREENRERNTAIKGGRRFLLLVQLMLLYLCCACPCLFSRDIVTL